MTERRQPRRSPRSARGAHNPVIAPVGVPIGGSSAFEVGLWPVGAVTLGS
jgi:hypothetical protein